MSQPDLFQKFGRTYEPGALIFAEGDSGEHMFILQEGEVRISKSVRAQEKLLATLRPGDFFGEMAILNNQPRSATARAATTCRCLVFDAQTFETMLRNHLPVAVRMIKKLSERLRHADAMIENLLLKDDYSKITNSLAQLHKMGKIRVNSGEKLQDIAAHAGVAENAARTYFKRLEELGIAALQGEGDQVVIKDDERLARLQRYLAMREEFINLEKPRELESDHRSRISYF